MEVELARPMLDLNRTNLPGDTEVYVLPRLLKIVSDKRGITLGGTRRTYSNVEFVAVHFDQHAGSAAEAEAQLRERLAVVDSLRTDLYRHADNRLLSNVITPTSTGLYTAFKQARLDPAMLGGLDPVLARDALIAPQTYPVPDNALNMLIHYTVGIAPDRLGPALTGIAALTMDLSGSGNHLKQHAARAEAVGVHCAGLIPQGRVQQPHLPELAGYLALVFTQVAAFADIVANSDDNGRVTGQPKNYVAALSRVPMRTVFDSLHDDVRAAIRGRAGAISGHIGDQIIPGFSDGDSRSVTNQSITIGNYIASALGGRAAVDQERVFGGMNETGLDPSVHGAADPDAATGRGVPVELRAYGTYRPSWPTFVAEAVTLLRWSRGMALSDFPKTGSTDHWLPEVTRLLDEYEVGVRKVRGETPLAEGESMFAVNWNVTVLHRRIAGTLKEYPGFPGHARGPGWQPTDLAGLACYRRYTDLTQRIGARIEGFDPDPFPPPFDFSGPMADEESDMESDEGSDKEESMEMN
ncbi:hypothetical protein [Streptosporangium sp. NPDC002524]|uniref:hypothetical protein n=1 Tax=Streptosporangium sp. NPDC002524 TaxID=3154537 RepID=UPI00331DE3F7